MSQSEASLFNQVSDMPDCDYFARKTQESNEIFRYQTDVTPLPVCYMSGQAFQGPSVQQAPGKLIDVESYLLTQPYREEQTSYVTTNNVRNLVPSMPDILQNRLLIPDCTDFIKTSYNNKVRRTDSRSESSTSAWDMINEPPKNQYLPNPGLDTRMAMKQEFKKREDAKSQSASGKNEDLTPAPEIKCSIGSSDLSCLHVFPNKDAAPTVETKIWRFDPNKDVGYYSNKLDSSTSQSPSVSPATLAAFSTIDSGATLGELLEQRRVKEGCKTTFFNWTSPCYPPK